MNKRIVALLLTVCLLFTSFDCTFAASGSMSNFTKSRQYSGQFADVPKSAWFYQYVKSAYEYGFVSGRTNTAYSPDGNITIAETLVIACQLNSIYYDKTINRSKTNPWYQPYVDFAVSNGIIGSRDYSNYSASATRAQFAEIMASALPSSALNALGTISSIPDVPSNASYANAVYKLYNAGILAGSDEYGTFKPKSNIKRSEVAVIVLNMAEPERRKLANIQKLSASSPRYRFLGLTLGEIKKQTGDSFEMLWDANYQSYFACFGSNGFDCRGKQWPTIYDIYDDWSKNNPNSLTVDSVSVFNHSSYKTNVELYPGLKVSMTYPEITKAVGNKTKIGSPVYWDDNTFLPGYHLTFKLDGYTFDVYWESNPNTTKAWEMTIWR